MVRMIDIKTAGLSQDLKELNSSKSKKESGYYNQKIEKAKLSLAQQEYDTKYSSASKEQKNIVQGAISRQRTKLREQEAIEVQKKKVYDHSYKGRVEKGLARAGNRFLGTLGKRVISRRVLKKVQAGVTMKNFTKEYRPEGVFSDPNRFFKGEMEETKRSMFFE